MPRVTIYGIPFYSAKALGIKIKDIFVNCAETRPEHIRVLFLQTIDLESVEDVEWAPMTDVLWLGRSQEVQDKTARALTQLFKENGFKDVQVTFSTILESCFYENGEHY